MRADLMDNEKALRQTLWSLRADRLVAVAMSPSIEGLASVLKSVDRATEVVGHRVNLKDLGDLDLPTGAKALAMTVTAVTPSNLGFVKLWPANATEPDASTVNYDPGTINIATGAIVPVGGANNQFNAKSPAAVDLVVDVVGYFNAIDVVGLTGPTGPAGPQYVLNAVVNAHGTLLVSSVPAGVSLAVSRTSPGNYLVTIAGLGAACPIPIANAFASTFMFLDGGGCGNGSVNTTLKTGDGTDPRSR